MEMTAFASESQRRADEVSPALGWSQKLEGTIPQPSFPETLFVSPARRLKQRQ